MSEAFSESAIRLPKRPIERITDPISQFMRIEAASGIVLLVATILALLLANLGLGETLHHLWSTPVGLSIGPWSGKLTLEYIINDGLMAIFFFVIGLEVKREITVGEFRSIKKAMLPIAGAIGGMVVPALVYLYFQHGQPAERGWGIVMATDIAFVVGCMALLGSRIPHALRVFLLMLAIADDIGAVLVIAIGYTDTLYLNWLMVGGATLGVIALLLRMGLQSTLVLWALSLVVWSCFLSSGVHATVAGVLLGLLIPARPSTETATIDSALTSAQEIFSSKTGTVVDVQTLRLAVAGVVSPVDRLIHSLHPWVSFVIMPVFAFCNAGVMISADALSSSVVVAVAAGLLVGKPLGIVGATLLVAKLKLAEIPSTLNLRAIIGGGFLAGIGFTMALFIATLALDSAQLEKAKVGVLLGSFVSAVIGMTILSGLPKRRSD